jgi:hypothetical protein
VINILAVLIDKAQYKRNPVSTRSFQGKAGEIKYQHEKE